MREELIKTITEKLGNQDALTFIATLDALNIGDDLQINEDSFSIQTSALTDVEAFKIELGKLKLIFLEEENTIFIKWTKPEPLLLAIPDKHDYTIAIHRMTSIDTPCVRDRVNTVTLNMIIDEEHTKTLWGIRQEDVGLPDIPPGSRVLDVGAGSGYLAAKIRDTLGCDVYALEPCLVKYVDYDGCVQRLGEDHVEKLTLQEALKSQPKKYFQAFDVVTVFKYNIPPDDKDGFIESLAKTVKPGGIVYITSVEEERVFDVKSPEYLIAVINKYFGTHTIQSYVRTVGGYGLITCINPKLTLEETSMVKQNNSKLTLEETSVFKQHNSKEHTMREDLIKAITEHLGSQDTPPFIATLNALNVGNDIQINKNGISIPRSVVNDIDSFSQNLRENSKVGRTFELSEVDDRLFIHTDKHRFSYYKEHNKTRDRRSLFHSRVRAKVLTACQPPKAEIQLPQAADKIEVKSEEISTRPTM